MNKSFIPQKVIQISELNTSDIKLRRLFIMIDGKKDILELSKLTHQSKEEVTQNIEKLVELKAISIDGLPDSSEESVEDNNLYKVECKDFRECLSKTLALFIGPAAFIIVDDYVFDKADLEYYKMMEIVENISTEIENLEDRKKFIDLMNYKVSEYKNKSN